MNSESPHVHLPPPGHPSLRGGQDTFASNPARLGVSSFQWLAANPFVLILCGCIAVAGIVLLFVKWVPGVVCLVAAATTPLKMAKQARRKFFAGDVCPGVVLSAQRNLVAVYTDLVAGGRRPHPAVQILKQPLHRMSAEAAYDGMRVATAAFYAGSVTDEAWKTFQPEVINCVVQNPAEIARVLASIPEREWQLLDSCVAQIPDCSPGLYHFEGAAAADGVPNYVPAPPYRPWFKAPAAIVGLVALGIVASLLIFINVVGFLAQKANRHQDRPTHHSSPAATQAEPQGEPAPAPEATQPDPPPQTLPANTNAVRPMPPTPAGPYASGQAVVANWGGRWIPGKITAVNNGGFTVMVQLNDQRFPHPLVLSTNQIRLR